MRRVAIYGFRCSPTEEKALIGRVNGFLATHNRTTSKSKNPSLLRDYAPLTIKHFYWNLNKEMGTWFDIYPNQDINGKYFFPDHKDCGWLMHVSLDLKRHPGVERQKSEAFLTGVLDAIQLDHVVLRERDDPAGLTRNGNIEPPVQ